MERDPLNGHVLIGQGGMEPNGKRFRLDIRKKYLYCKGDGALEQLAERNCACLSPRSVES